MLHKLFFLNILMLFITKCAFIRHVHLIFIYLEGSAEDYANSLFSQIFFCSFENLMVKFTFCETTEIHVCAKKCFYS